MTNRYPTTCSVCACRVPRGRGSVEKIAGVWRGFCARHADYTAQDSHGIHTFVIGGREYYRNARGLCEDAPCCGCCTI